MAQPVAVLEGRDRPALTAWLLLGPCVLYLFAFSIFPLIYSLRLSFTDLTAATGTGSFVGLANYGALLVDPLFWNAAMNSAIMVAVAVALQVVLGMALALFFDLDLRGAWIVRGMLILPMLITPIVVGVMWRALLNPDWGLVNWSIARLGLPSRRLAGLRRHGDADAGHRRLLAVDAVRFHHRVRPPAGAAAATCSRQPQVDGAGRDATFRHVTLPLLMPAIVFAAVFRAIDAFRSFDLVYGLTYGGPARCTTTLASSPSRTASSSSNYGYAAAIAYVMVIIIDLGTTVPLRFVQLRRGQTR